MQGVDSSGYSGLKDKVDNHEGRLINGVLLSSVCRPALPLLVVFRITTSEVLSRWRGSGGLSQAGAKITEKNLDIQPTIEIRPGEKFNIFVNKDLVLYPYGG